VIKWRVLVIFETFYNRKLVRDLDGCSSRPFGAMGDRLTVTFRRRITIIVFVRAVSTPPPTVKIILKRGKRARTTLRCKKKKRRSRFTEYGNVRWLSLVITRRVTLRTVFERLFIMFAAGGGVTVFGGRFSFRRRRRYFYYARVVSTANARAVNGSENRRRSRTYRHCCHRNRRRLRARRIWRVNDNGRALFST